jgi:hypothetical protein
MMDQQEQVFVQMIGFVPGASERRVKVIVVFSCDVKSLISLELYEKLRLVYYTKVHI